MLCDVAVVEVKLLEREVTSGRIRLATTPPAILEMFRLSNRSTGTNCGELHKYTEPFNVNVGHIRKQKRCYAFVGDGCHNYLRK